MPHKRASLSKVLCSETLHTCFSLCSSDGLTNVHLYKNLKIGLCKHFRLAHPPVAEYSELFCLVGSGAVEEQGWLGMQVSDALLVYTSPTARSPTLDTVYPAQVFLHLSDAALILGLTF